MVLNIKKVIVGVSGGVDSAVTALLLRNKGFEVIGVFMQNWDIKDEQGQCSADRDFEDANFVCNQLGIKLHYVNFVKHYWNYVFSNLVKDYESGFTPNPDILCNRHIKFDYFIQHAQKYLKADAVATGHYARTNFGPYLENYDPNKNVKLLRALCVHKDQTFFLSQVKQEYLRGVMFPLGDLMKSEVKEIARKNGFVRVAEKKESMGICFIGSRNFQTFISEYIEKRPGKFVDIETNMAIGEHEGVHQWTIGQKSRLANFSTQPYIARKNVQNNKIYVAIGWEHPALFSCLFLTSEPHWISSEPQELIIDNILECDFKFQHVEILRKCRLCKTKQGLLVNLETPLRAITPGQYAVFYKGNECLGSARIIYSGPPVYFYRKYKVADKFNSGGVLQINDRSSDAENIEGCTKIKAESVRTIKKCYNFYICSYIFIF